MRPIEYKHTVALFHKIKNDLNRISYIISITVQVVLFLYYSFAIYSHRSSVIYVILYSCFFLISFLVFFDILIYHEKKDKSVEDKKKHKKRHSVLKIVGIVNKFALLVVSLIPIVKGTASDFDKVTTLAVAILILIQTCYLFFASLLDKYLDWLKIALELDYKDSLLFKNPSKSFQDKIHDIASNLNGKSEESEFSKNLNLQIEEDEKKRRMEKEKKKQIDKENRKQDIKLILDHFKNERINKMISDDKIKKEIEKEKKKAEKLLNDKKKLESFLSSFEKEIETTLIKENLSYIEEYYYRLKEEEMPNEKKKALLVNLLYYRKPLVNNDVTIEDNLKVQLLTSLK